LARTKGTGLRYFDHHLKEIQTGIESEKPVHYFTMGEEKWKAADTWPPPGFEPMPLYFAEGRTLRPGDPPAGDGFDTYEVDYSVGSGRASRWVSLVNVSQVRIQYPDRKQQDARLLTYTSSPLEWDTEVTGHLIITLFVRSTATDGQFFVYLEDVTANGEVYYVTEGVFRAIHRHISQETPPYEIPVPYHTFKRQDARPLVPGKVAKITFDLQPISYFFRKGHSIRVAIAGADAEGQFCAGSTFAAQNRHSAQPGSSVAHPATGDAAWHQRQRWLKITVSWVLDPPVEPTF
jgi:putative CocE/NonD family hydrolase